MTATVHLREGARGDRDAILALRALAFPNDEPEKRRPDFWDWEFMAGYAGAAHVFVAEAGDRIVGHFAFVPQLYTANAQSFRGALAVDVMTHPDFQRQKVFSLLAKYSADQLKKEFPIVIAYQIREAVMGGMVAGGWRPAEQIPVLLKPLSLRRILRDLWSAADPAAGPPASGQPEAAPSIRAVRPADFDQLDTLLSTSAARQKRSSEFLHWRYQENPHWRYELDGFFEGERLRAFVIHRPSILRGLRSLAIADAGVSPGNDDSFRQLMTHVCRRGRKRGLGIAAALMSRHHPAYGALRRNGFFPGPHRFRLLLQVFDETLRWISDAPWSLSWGDTDHL